PGAEAVAEGPRPTVSPGTRRPAVLVSHSGLGASAVGSTWVSLSWNAPASDGGAAVTSYRIYRATTSGGEPRKPVTTVSGTSATRSEERRVGKEYSTGTAVNAVSQGPPSSEAPATPRPAV